jgi:CheY-like chemotaxis protein
MQNIKKDLAKEEFDEVFTNGKLALEDLTSIEEKLLVYENLIKEITSQKNVFILLFDIENRIIKIPTLDITIPIVSDMESIIIECYEDKHTKLSLNVRRSSMYRQKIDNFIDAKIKDLLLIPILENNQDKRVSAMIWVATEYKSLDEFSKNDINYLNILSNHINNNIIDSKVHSNFDDNINILIIDSSPIIVRLLEFILRDYYTNIISVEDGIEGINKFKSKRIDIIFIDELILSIKEDKAIEAIRNIEIEKEFDSIPIFAITSDSGIEVRDNLIKSGANIVLHKPIDAKGILTAIKTFRVLRKKV